MSDFDDILEGLDDLDIKELEKSLISSSLSVDDG